ncbi:hypothetical protein BC628DRAFT_1380576 [Trametes gibbosa]|nr:hypothetical protein BC628DRAFT_1380576 [Trametes gibbosa]
MVPSANNRKPFPLNVYIPPLSRSLSHGLPSSKDSAAARSDRSLQSFPPVSSRISLLSPLSPLYPASLHLKQEQPVLPIPLSDGLDPSEKMKLLRKTRKLSRILGEVPIPVSVSTPSPATSDSGFLGVLEEPSLTSASASTSASSSPAKFLPPGVFQQGSLKRSATVSHNRHDQQNDIHRARSLASLRPSLTLPPGAVTIHPSPIAPVVFSWPENNPIPPSPAASESEGASGRLHAKRDSTVSSRRDSVASSIFPTERTPEQVLRARAAKLARQLGDNIPPEVLLRAASPPPLRSPLPSPSALSFAEASLTIHETPRRTLSIRPVRAADREDLKRRLSLDIHTFVRVPEAVVPSFMPDAERHSTIPLKDKLGWAAREGSAPRPRTPGDAVVEGSSLDAAPPAVARDSDLGLDWEYDLSGARSLEKQRALNVRRARKMLQMFGNEPPPALFQITNIPPSATTVDDISVVHEATHYRNDSHATTVSLPASTLSATGTHDYQDSVTTHSSSGENLSPLIFRKPGSTPPSQSPTPQPGTVYDDEEFAPSLPPRDTFQVEVCPLSPLSLPSLASSSAHSLSASITSDSTSCAPPTEDRVSLSSPIRRSLQLSPHADQTMFLKGAVPVPSSISPPTVTNALPGVHPSDPHFRVRRIRAAKLSRFFGVGLNDIAGMLRTGSSNVPSSPPVAAARTGPSSVDTARTESSETSDTASPPSLREFRRSDSVETIPSPSSPTESTHPPESLRRSRPARPVTSAGIVSAPSASMADTIQDCQRTLSAGRRSQSVTRSSRRPQTQSGVPSASTSPSSFPAVGAPRDRSNSEPEALSAVHTRTFSTTVEVATESKRPFAFLDVRRQGRGKELQMHDVIRELRKIK